MPIYFSTFITGFSEVVEKEIKNQISDIEIDLLLDGLILYKTNTSIDKIRGLKFLNNSFFCLKKIDRVNESSLTKIVKDIIQDKNIFDGISRDFSKKNTKLRIRATIHNQFVAIDKLLLQKLEQKVIKSLPNVIINRAEPDIELLISIRSEGFALVGLQFTKRANYEKSLERGELYPELAYLLCLLSEPNETDIFLDPFAGYGAIPKSRLLFPYKKVIAGDIDKKLHENLEQLDTKIHPVLLDALNTQGIFDSSIDKIVTDPPWGFYDKQTDILGFYEQMLREVFRVLKPNGILVILTAQKDIFEELIKKFEGNFLLEQKCSTLVSGRKAGVYKLRKVISH